jgi:hypothetical protein
MGVTMKRQMSKTPATYMESQWTYRKGPIENVRYDPELRTQHARAYVNVARYNGIQLRRKIRLASQQPMTPILRKKATFHNNPTTV